MESLTLHHLANVALSRGASYVVPDAIEGLPSTRSLRYCFAMPHIDTFPA